MRRVLRNGAVIECLLWGSRVTLPSGEIVLGTPHDSVSYRETAQRLGYGDDVVGMARDHDAMHAWLCDAVGLRDSASLRVAAGLDAAADLAAVEEHAVLALQKFCRLAGINLFAEDA